jgi:hypothetical protein
MRRNIGKDLDQHINMPPAAVITLVLTQISCGVDLHCRRYVRRNIGKYLDQHINMPPAAVLVTAVLRTEVAGSAATDLGVHEVQPSTPNNTAHTGSSSSVGDGGEGTSSSSRTESAVEEAQSYDHPLTRVLLSCFGWLVKPNARAAQAKAGGSSSSNTSTVDSAAAAKLLPSANRGSAASTSCTSSDGSSSPADAYAVVDTAAASSSSSTSRDTQAASSSSSSSSSGGQGPPNMAELVGSALQRLSDSVVLPQLRLQHKASQTHVVETLVGIAEVSFQERTRSQALTLNPPQVRPQFFFPIELKLAYSLTPPLLTGVSQTCCVLHTT